ncbi:transcriptional regulator, TetR family [Micromonospora coriariae]|uniref:Transcriptional regulator, TetR family n=1 Tax=Micromonospora coriariae TaxID=285665 RepID=A0A1C4U669_9ACTN|nr:TetR/AcrR family transcriptional regulator [Micromonospora coriariae]SCE67205.1 transcriptional regulator, TetR family [Micromonospora coriariae]
MTGRTPTFTERARRAQLVEVTVGIVAAHGYAGCSLQRIADAAGITKAAVIYHFATKDAVIRAAYDAVIEALVGHVAERIAEAPTAESKADAYVCGLIGYLAAHPDHVRLIIEAADGDRGSPGRWEPFAGLIDDAKASGAYRPDVDSRMLAILVGGAIDAAVGQSLREPAFDLHTAAEAVVDLLHRAALAAR